ncbi:MAG: diphosphomevalonate decarboxylase [Brachybacterium sp.]|nr:diphosphomevalonate decarboxylase [Brachybacterium sp.]
MRTATARAHPNIALVKYWGKRDEELILPAAGSLSLTLDGFATTTTVSLDPSAAEDRFTLNGAAASPTQSERVTRFVDLVRSRAGSSSPAVVRSRNEAPTGAGLASSASGFAALAVAAATAYGLDLDRADLSRLARRGSGSATRSLVDGLSIWHAGDDAASFAEPIDGPAMSMVIVTVDAAEKAVSSREAMRRTAATSPYYAGWVDSTAHSLREMTAACRAGDFTRVGEITELNALRMHAAIEACEPSIRYLRAGSVAVFDAVEQLRADGIEAYATADAGPNVVVISRPADAAAVAERLGGLGAVRVVSAGPGAHLIPEEDCA